jgi:hypothetical protein
MTLRDWFAGQALAALAVAIDWYGEEVTNVEVVHCAKAAYMLADSMIVARKKS